MKKTRKVLTILLVLSLIIGSLSFVNAATDKLNISKGTRQGDIVTFTITLPQGGGLNGDANDNGRVDEYKDYEAVDSDGVTRPAYEDYNVDAYLIQGYVAKINSEDELNMLLADYNLDGSVDIADVVGMNTEKELLKNPITLNGTLAESSTYKMSKNSDGTYKVQVTIPSEEDGTIGITVKQRVFKYSSTVANEEISSDLLTVSKDDNYELNIKISDGIKEGNKVTFKIDMPKDTGLQGDVNGDGKVDSEDIQLLQDFLLGKEVGEEFNSVLADCVNDGVLNVFDLSILRRIVLYNSDDDKTNDSIKLNGTLAENSTYELVKDQDGSYKIIVTIPENAEEGTIGVTVDKETFKTADKKVNKELVSNLFDLAKNQNDNSEEFKVIDKKEQDLGDGKVKVTITVNKELDKDKIPEGWELSEDGKSISKVMDKGKTEEITLVAKDGSTLKYSVVAGSTLEDEKDETTANTKIPQTGVRNTMLLVIAGIAIAGTVVFVRSRKMLK